MISIPLVHASGATPITVRELGRPKASRNVLTPRVKREFRIEASRPEMARCNDTYEESRDKSRDIGRKTPRPSLEGGGVGGVETGDAMKAASCRIG